MEAIDVIIQTMFIILMYGMMMILTAMMVIGAFSLIWFLIVYPLVMRSIRKMRG